MKWKDFFADQVEEEKKEWQQAMFPKEKTNLPAKNSKNLLNFLTSVKSELTGTTLNKS